MIRDGSPHEGADCNSGRYLLQDRFSEEPRFAAEEPGASQNLPNQNAGQRVCRVVSNSSGTGVSLHGSSSDPPDCMGQPLPPPGGQVTFRIELAFLAKSQF